MSTIVEAAGATQRRPPPNTQMTMKGEDADGVSVERRRMERGSLDGGDTSPSFTSPPSTPDYGGARETRCPRPRRSPPLVKKCRICFQTDILNERALAVGKGPNRSLGALLRTFGPWSRSERRGAQAAAPDDGFISPCACKGSMAWVHRQCLEEWRYKSARRDSFYNCEYCFVAYRFKHTWLAALLNNPLTLLLVTMLLTGLTALAIVFLAGAIFPLRLADLAEQLTAEATINHRTTNAGDGGGIFGIDGAWMAIPPPTSTKYRWVTRSDIPLTAATTAAAVPAAGGDATGPTRTSPGAAPGKSRNRSTSTRASAHSPVSYFNIAYWLTGHSLDEREEEQNDFLLAMMDVSTVKLWLVAMAGLGVAALVRDFTAWSLLVALCLVFGLAGLYQSSPTGSVSTLAWLFFPVPALLGSYRYVCWQYEGVESFMDTLIKNFSAELENYQPPPTSTSS